MTLHDTSVPHKTHALQHAHSTRSRALTVHVSRQTSRTVIPHTSSTRHALCLSRLESAMDPTVETADARPLIPDPSPPHAHVTRTPHGAPPLSLIHSSHKPLAHPLWDRALWALGKHSSTLDRWQASQRRRCHHPPASRLSSPASPAHRGSFSPRRPRLTDASHNRQPHAPTRARAATVQEAAAHPRAPAHACPRQAPDLSRMISAAHEPSAGRHPEARRPPPPS